MPQFARPNADVTIGGWIFPGSGGAPLYTAIDETVRNDADFIMSAANPIADLAEVAVSTVGDPSSDQDHTVRYTYRKEATGGRIIDLTVLLVQGVTVIASWSHLDIPGALWTQANQLLTAPQAASITNYADLRLRFLANSSGGGGNRSAQVSWAELEVPDLTLTGSIDSTSQIGPSELEAFKNISGSISASSTFSGEIHGFIGVIGSIDATSSLAGDMTTFDSVKGSINASSSLQASMNLTPMNFAGQMDGVGALVADRLVAYLNIEATINILFGFRGASAFRADLFNEQAFVGDIDGSSFLLGRATQFLAVTSSLDGAGTLVGDATTLVAMSGSIDGTSNVTGDMTTFDSVKGTIVGQSQLTANGSLVPLALKPFPLGGQSSLQADALRLILGASGFIDGQSSLSAGELLALITFGTAQGDAVGSLEALRLLAVKEFLGDPIQGVSTLGPSTMTTFVAMSGSIDGSTSVAADLWKFAFLEGGSIDGASSLAASMRFIVNLEGQFDCVSAIVPVALALQPLAMQASISGTPNLVGVLRFEGEGPFPQVIIDQITGPGGTGDPEGPPTGGYAILIRGVEFALPPEPSDTGFVGGTYPETVKVEFGGEASPHVEVLTAELLFVIVPAFRGNGNVEDIPAVDVRVVNLDPDTGEELPGPENEAIEPGGWKYQRAQLDSTNSPGNLLRLCREVLRVLKRQIIPNVALTQHTDYDDTVNDLLNIIGIAELPALVLVGPTLVNNRFYSLNQKQEVQDPLSSRDWFSLRTPRTVDVVFEFIGVADKNIIVLNFMDVVEQFFELNKWLELDIDPNDPSKGRVKYELELRDEASVETTPNESNVRHFTGSFEIRGFDIELGEMERSSEVDNTDTDGEVIIDLESI